MRAVFGLDDAERLERIARRCAGCSTPPPAAALFALAGHQLGPHGPRSPWGRFNAARAPRRRVLYEEIAARRADPDAADRDDILSLLLAARDEDGEPLTDASCATS